MRNAIASSLLCFGSSDNHRLLSPTLLAQRGGDSRDAEIATNKTRPEKELDSVAIIDRKVMIPMSDGKRMAADIYRPKDESKKYGTIFVRTPYNFNYWDIGLGAPRNMSAELERGQARLRIR